MEVEIAAMGPEAAPEAWALYRRAVLEGDGAPYSAAERRAWVGPEAEPPWMAARLAEGRGWVARRDGAPLGFLVAKGLGAPGSAPAHLDLFFVLPEARGTGIAAALYAAFADAAGSRPLDTFASLSLRPFLERRGWHVVRADPQKRTDPLTGETQVLLRYVMTRPPTSS